MRALVLSGGGARGAYELGVYKALHEAGWRFDLLVGTSVGAITAAAIATGRSLEELEGLWKAFNFGAVKPRRDVWRFPRWTHLVKSEPVLRFIEESIDFERVRRSPMRVLVNATDLNTGDVVTFTNEDLTPRRLLASASIPLVFPVIEEEGRHYWDGGAVMNTPLRPALLAGATDVTTVLLSPLGARPLRPPRNLWEAITRTTELTLLGNLRQDIQQARAMNAMIDRGLPVPPPFRRVEFHVIGPEDGLGLLSFFNFSRRKTREFIDWGYRDGREYLAGHGHAPALES